MTDNTRINVGVDGDTIASDDVGGVKFQRMKMALGVDGVTDGDVSSSNPLPIKIGNSSSLDAFSRLRISNPTHVYDANFVYSLDTLTQEAIVAESGATVAHDATNSCALMTFSSTPTGGKAYLQSFEHFRYQSGRSQLIYMTFNFVETKANTLKFIGYGDRSNGIFLEQSGSVAQVKIYSTTDTASETVIQSAWNLDKLDGTGSSGVTLNLAKAQVLIIDMQWHGTGRVRIGFVIDGTIIYVHEFNHANVVTVPYMKSGTLPVSAGMTCTGTVSTTMRYIACTVISEGGELDVGALNFSQETPSLTAGSDARTHAISIRPKTTFNGVANRITMVPTGLDVLVTGNNPVKWELCIGDVITGTTTFADVNTTHSGMEYNTAGTTSGTPSLVIDTGFIAASTVGNTSEESPLFSRIPITLNAAGAVRANGTLTLLVTGLGASSACRVKISWKEIR